MAILLISHDLGVIAEVADSVVVMYCGGVVETGTAEECFDRPAHPYTRGLLESIPRLDDTRTRLYQIPGASPSPSRASGLPVRHPLR